jgi:hypothetical protein
MTNDILFKITKGFTQYYLTEIEEEVLVRESSDQMYLDQTCFGTRVNSAGKNGNL